MNVIADIQKWYASNCDGEWEREYGLKIGTMANPGWSVTIDLEDTNLEGKEFQPVRNHQSEESRVECRVEENRFRGFGDPYRLEEILRIFLNWAMLQTEDWLKPPPTLSEEEQERLEDNSFWDSPGEELGPEICKHEGCYRKRIRYSVMCREHHFEMVRKRPAPQRAS
jgi:hypothetical protein